MDNLKVRVRHGFAVSSPIGNPRPDLESARPLCLSWEKFQSDISDGLACRLVASAARAPPNSATLFCPLSVKMTPRRTPATRISQTESPTEILWVPPGRSRKVKKDEHHVKDLGRTGKKLDPGARQVQLGKVEICSEKFIFGTLGQEKLTTGTGTLLPPPCKGPVGGSLRPPGGATSQLHL